MTTAWRVGLVLWLMGLAGTPAEAQTTATLVGQVVDATGGRLAGVRITVTNEETAAVRSAATDAEGRFALASLPPGQYVVRAELPKFRPLVRTGVRLTVGQQLSLALALELGAAEEVSVV